MTTADERKPWEQQPGETAKQFAGFVCYRDLPANERSVLKAYRSYAGGGKKGVKRGWKKKAPTFFTEWATKNHWLERARDFDGHAARLDAEAAAKARQERIAKAINRHADVAESQEEVIALFTNAVLQYLQNGEFQGKALEKFAGIKPETLLALFVQYARALPAAQKTTREALGIELEQVKEYFQRSADAGRAKMDVTLEELQKLDFRDLAARIKDRAKSR